MLGDKVHIDSDKTCIFEAIARQIHSHKVGGCQEIGLTREVHRWSCVLHHFFFVENSRNKSKELKQKAIETELYNTLSRLFPAEDGAVRV